ncbi:MAG: hypothetical protein ACP5IM_05800 [Candidatus Bathyarchaeia archaeon]
MSTIEVKVVSQNGKCAFGHKVGDKIVFDGKSVRGDICCSASWFCCPRFTPCDMALNFHGARIRELSVSC